MIEPNNLCQRHLNILFLTITDQSNSRVGMYVDLHCNYDFHNWVQGFSALPHNVFSFDYYESFVCDGSTATEKSILTLLERHNIDLMIVPNMNFEIGVSFLNIVREKKVRCLVVFFDDSLRFEAINKFYIGHCDHILTKESKHSLKLYESFDCDVKFFPNLPSKTFYSQLMEVPGKPFSGVVDINFVGQKIADRYEYIKGLLEAGIPVSTFGGGWEGGKIDQTTMLQIFRHSKISLNFTKDFSGTCNKQLKGRSFEIILAGGFLLTEYDEELADYFEIGKDVDVFRDVDECVEKINYYLKNPEVREDMRSRAYGKALSYLNFESYWNDYISQIMGEKIAPSPCSYVDFPKKSIICFCNWSATMVIARIQILTLRLALDQLRFFFRELKYLSTIHPWITQWTVFIWLCRFLVKKIKSVYLGFLAWFNFTK